MPSSNTTHRQYTAWLRLIRLPNLLTVPGDPLAGALLAAGVSGVTAAGAFAVALAALAATLIYAAGLIQNDLCDMGEDRHRRPERPLPSGRVRKMQARRTVWGLTLAGLTAAGISGTNVALVALLLVLCVNVYNRIAKNIPQIGSLAMGLCRALSLALGASAIGWRPTGTVSAPGAAAAGILLTIYGITEIARTEDGIRQPTRLLWIPPVAIGLTWIATAMLLATPCIAGVVLGCLATLDASHAVIRLSQRIPGAPPLSIPALVGTTVGRLIRTLLILQASLAMLSGSPDGFATAWVLMALWPLHRQLAKSFGAS